MADDRGDVDDLPAAPLNHFGEDRLDECNRRAQVQRDHPLVVLGRHLGHGAEAGPSRVVDQDIDRAEALAGEGKRAVPIRLDGGVHGDGQRAVGAQGFGE